MQSVLSRGEREAKAGELGVGQRVVVGWGELEARIWAADVGGGGLGRAHHHQAHSFNDHLSHQIKR